MRGRGWYDSRSGSIISCTLRTREATLVRLPIGEFWGSTGSMAKKTPKRGMSKVGRIARLGTLTSKVSGSYFGQSIRGNFQGEESRKESVRRTHLANAERLASTMGALKGAAMKLGQSIAVAADGLDLPPEARRVLSRLQDKGDPIPFEEIKVQIEAELGASLDELFDRFDSEPLGTASLAQAHAAWLPDGTPVVVKVLHQGIESSVATDIRAMRTLFVTGRILRRDRSEVDRIFSEIQERITEELDYYKEAANLEFFHRELAHIEGLSVPRTYSDLCTERVLTMDRIVGAPLEKFLEQASPEARQRAGTILAKSFHEQLYRLRTLHADPHGGNYLFHTDGSVGLIDFGCVKRFDIWWLARYARTALSIVDDDRARFLERAREMEILCVDDKPEAERVLWKFATIICGPLRVPWFRCGVDDDELPSQLKKIAKEVIQYPELQTPPDLIYLHRSLGGIYAMLRRLQHEFDYSDIFRAHARYVISVAEGQVDDGAPVGWEARAS